MPSDPFEAELLMMAEAVANANKAADSDSETEDEDADGGRHPCNCMYLEILPFCELIALCI